MSPTAVNRAPTAVEAGKRFNNWAVSLKPQSTVFAGSLLGKAIIMQYYPKSAIFFLVLCPMHNQFKKSSLNKHTLFHMTFFFSVFKSILSFQLNTIFVNFYLYLQRKASLKLPQKMPFYRHAVSRKAFLLRVSSWAHKHFTDMKIQESSQSLHLETARHVLLWPESHFYSVLCQSNG